MYTFDIDVHAFGLLAFMFACRCTFLAFYMIFCKLYCNRIGTEMTRTSTLMHEAHSVHLHSVLSVLLGNEMTQKDLHLALSAAVLRLSQGSILYSSDLS